jgi:dolichol-phosphate mannosyltransferase
MTHLSVVIPVYNENSLVEELVKRVITNLKKITEDFEIIIVDDGSQDETWAFIEKESRTEKRIKAVKFSRNFGHHYAITAGLQDSKGEWVVVMDGDLQDRPEVIPDLYKKATEGFDVVFVSRQNRPESILYLMLQKLFYLILRLLSGIKFDSTQANFSILSRNVVEAFKNFPENSRFYSSTIFWLGFKRVSIKASHGSRFSGKPSYTIKSRLKLATDIILSFSERPLKFSIFIGLFFSTISMFSSIMIVVFKFWYGFEVLGWTSLISATFFIGGIILMVLGVMGLYIGRIFQEVKRRPLFIIERRVNQ